MPVKTACDTPLLFYPAVLNMDSSVLAKEMASGSPSGAVSKTSLLEHPDKAAITRCRCASEIVRGLAFSSILLSLPLDSRCSRSAVSSLACRRDSRSLCAFSLSSVQRSAQLMLIRLLGDPRSSEFPLCMRQAQRKLQLPTLVRGTRISSYQYRSTYSSLLMRGLTNERDFPVPRLRRSFRKRQQVP